MQGSGKRLVQLSFHANCDRWQTVSNVIFEVRGDPMRLERCVITVLLVNQEARTVGSMPLCDKHQATGFFASFDGQL